MSQDELRRSNCSALLRRIHTSGPTSRASLTHALGLNRSTIGDLTALLEDAGLVHEEAPSHDETSRSRRSGRPSLVVSPRTDMTVLAVALDVDRITAAVVGLGGTILARRTRLHQRGAHDVEDVVSSVRQLADELLAEVQPRHCFGVGASIPGAVRARDGLVHFGPNLGWVDAPFADRLSEALSLPVWTGNEANLGMLAENVRGKAEGVSEAAYISGSVGIGGGFLVGGRLLGGADGYAGEVGHLPVDSDGRPCRCGSIGCWETKVGENELLTMAGRLPGGGPEAVAEVIAAAEAGEPRATESVAQVALWTGRGLRAVINLFNPEIIILGGVLSRVLNSRKDLILDGLKRESLIADRVVLTVAAHGHDSPLIGAAELAFEPLLADPQQMLRPDVTQAVAEG